MNRLAALLLLLATGCTGVATPVRPAPREASRASSTRPIRPKVPSDETFVRPASSEVEFVLPFPREVATWVAQGNDQAPTHADEWNRHAFDFDVPEGTPVTAAADGLVIYVRQDSTNATGNWQDNNEVVLRHRDGTFTVYLHLKAGSARVTGGEQVVVGELLAASGNTGRSTGPHLHFCRMVEWRDGPSLPCVFVDVAGDGIPRTGQRIGARVGRVRSVAEAIGR